MGKIKRVFLSDNLGTPISQKGSGLVTDINNNFSGDKKLERLIFNIEITFNTGETNYIVIKIAPLSENLDTYYSKYYYNILDSSKTPENVF